MEKKMLRLNVMFLQLNIASTPCSFDLEPPQKLIYLTAPRRISLLTERPS